MISLARARPRDGTGESASPLARTPARRHALIGLSPRARPRDVGGNSQETSRAHLRVVVRKLPSGPSHIGENIKEISRVLAPAPARTGVKTPCPVMFQTSAACALRGLSWLLPHAISAHQDAAISLLSPVSFMIDPVRGPLSPLKKSPKHRLAGGIGFQPDPLKHQLLGARLIPRTVAT